MPEDYQPHAVSFEESVPATYSTNSTVQVSNADDFTLAIRVVQHLWPWEYSTYPGRIKLMLASISNRVGYAAVRAWCRGKNRLPEWAARQWAAVLAARVAQDQALIAELTEYADREAARPKVLKGCCAVWERGGVVRDGRGGYRGVEGKKD